MKTPPDAKQAKHLLKLALEGLQALAEIIRHHHEIPSGHLYAKLMAKVTLEDYNRMIGILKNAGLVTETPAHLLRWNGPKAKKEAQS